MKILVNKQTCVRIIVAIIFAFGHASMPLLTVQAQIEVSAEEIGEHDALVNSASGDLRSEPNQSSSRIGTYPKNTELNIIKIDGPWTRVEVIDTGAIGSMPTCNLLFSESWTVSNCKNVIATPQATTAPSVAGQLQSLLRQSKVNNVYRQEANRFAQIIANRLGEFQLPTLGITQKTMQAAITRPDAGDRANAVVREVWGEWIKLIQTTGGNLYTSEPSAAQYGLSPFRQLIIRLIQGRQPPLIDNQQHALFNFFTRFEENTIWYGPLDPVIAAVNRESFLWP